MIVGIGVDLVEIARVERMLADHGERIIARMFTDHETHETLARADRPAALAARIAAKEAAYKALTGNALARAIGWREMEVRKNADGAPSLHLTGRALARAQELSVDRIFVSLSHSERTAIAMVVLEARR
jgi:holo-[acyl-carrier protein] synthase